MSTFEGTKLALRDPLRDSSKVLPWESTSQDITMTEDQLQTPVKAYSKPSMHDLDVLEIESTIVGNSQDALLEHTPNDYDHRSVKNFDGIAVNINNTILELNIIYSQIGYSTQEISTKKEEIFQVIGETIMNFTTNLQREKNNMENECEWLRQQIRIILAMINDNSGEKYLTSLNRGIVFNNHTLYEEGYKEHVLSKLAKIQNNKTFYVNSPFNLTNNDNDNDTNDLSFEQQYEYMLKNIPQLSLLQLKSKLNAIFLEVLRSFVQLFRKLTDLTLSYIENQEVIGELHSPNANISLLQSLPRREEAEQHKILIEEFEDTLKYLKLYNEDTKPESIMHANGQNAQCAFIVSSPRKSKADSEQSPQQSNQNKPSNIDGILSHLRDLNYQIVRVIRVLKITKITPEILSSILKEIDYCDEEIASRKDRISDLISQCFDHINALHLTDEQIIDIQKQAESTHESNSSEGYFDVETLKFIKSDPKQFGLNDDHLVFLEKFASTLLHRKEAKQKTLNNYLDACRGLWDKLGENSEYVENFIHANSFLTDISILNFKLELNKLHMKRSEFIESFITEARNEIEKYWRKILYSNEEEQTFKYYNYDSNTDSTDKEVVLSEHEKELAKLKHEYSTKQVVLELYEQMNELVQDQAFLIESSKDSSRLLSKNSCKILLNEEKLRKRINKNMPKILDSLKTEIIKYNNQSLENGQRPLEVNGEDLFEKLLIMEAEQSNQSSRGARRQPFRSQLVSPSKPPRRIPSGRPSPTKSAPATAPKSTRQRQPLMTTRKSPTGASPNKQTLAKKRPALNRIPDTTFHERTYNNLTTIRLTNAINTSNGRSSQIPIPNTSACKSNSFPVNRPNSNIASRTSSNSSTNNYSRLGNVNLQPLHSTLKQPDIYEDTLTDSPQHSSSYNLSKVSPLKINHNLTNNLSILSSKLRLSPAKDSGKENDPYELSPLKLTNNLQLDISENQSKSSRRQSIVTCDSSIFIGEDYQSWRDERIKQFNGFS